MTHSVLLTLGRLPKGLDIARSFARLGWRVVVADPSPSHLMGASRSVAKSHQTPPPSTNPRAYLVALARIIAQESIDFVVPVSEDVMFVAELPNFLDLAVPVFSMPAGEIHRVHDKFDFIALAAELGLKVPESAAFGTELAQKIANSGPFILKPRHSCAGNGVRFYPVGATIVAQKDDVIQRLIRGEERSTCTLAMDGKVIGTAIYRATVLSGTVACGFERVEVPLIDAWVERFVAATHWNGFISFDFMLDSEGVPYAIECNPRTTSGLHFFETEDIAPAILGQKSTIRFKKERKLMQFWSCVQETQDSFGDWPRFRDNLVHLWKTKDVTFASDDPWPMISMPWTARGIIADARRDKIPFGIAATRDLAWTRPLSEWAALSGE